MGNFRVGLFVAIAFVIGVGSASEINTVLRSPLWRFGDSRTIDKYLQANSVRKLQLGGGGSAPAGWLNSDIEPGREDIYLDAASRYPLSLYPQGQILPLAGSGPHRALKDRRRRRGADAAWCAWKVPRSRFSQFRRRASREADGFDDLASLSSCIIVPGDRYRPDVAGSRIFSL